MLLTSPVIITPRLLPGVRIGDAFVSIEYSDRQGDEGRTRYRYHVDIPGIGEYSADDLQSGCGHVSLIAGLESLISFLSACGETASDSIPGDNNNLFPQAVAEWAAENSDELSMLSCELEENDNLIQESTSLQGGIREAWFN